MYGQCFSRGYRRPQEEDGENWHPFRSFHCDEALGCFLLRQTSTYKDAEIVRTRDESVLSELDIVIDVGGTYDAGAH